MDERLTLLDGHRVGSLRKEDLPELSLVILDVLRGRGAANTLLSCGSEYIVLKSRTAKVYVLREDWLKVLPEIQQGAFDTLLNPVTPSRGYLDPVTEREGSLMDHADKPLYERILTTLQGFFTETFPVAVL